MRAILVLGGGFKAGDARCQHYKVRHESVPK